MRKGYMYILKCSDGSYYTGSTINLEKRVKEHKGSLDMSQKQGLLDNHKKLIEAAEDGLLDNPSQLDPNDVSGEFQTLNSPTEDNHRNESCKSPISNNKENIGQFRNWKSDKYRGDRGANYTRKRRPVELVYYEEYERIDQAFYREKQVQGWSRKKKEALINGEHHLLPELAKKTFNKKGVFDMNPENLNHSDTK